MIWLFELFPLIQLAAVVFLRGEQHQEEVVEERVLLIPERRRKPQGNKKSRMNDERRARGAHSHGVGGHGRDDA